MSCSLDGEDSEAIIVAVRDPKKGSFSSSPMEPTDDRQGYRMSLIGQKRQLSAPHGLFSNQLPAPFLIRHPSQIETISTHIPPLGMHLVLPRVPLLESIHTFRIHILPSCEGLYIINISYQLMS